MHTESRSDRTVDPNQACKSGDPSVADRRGRRRRSIASLAIVLAAGLGTWTMTSFGDPPTPPPTAGKLGDCTLSGPFTHDNLTVFLIHGPDKLAGRRYLTLQEGLEQKKVIVHETGNVNELAVENIGDVDVYIQSGDIVRGGQQDRTLGDDLVLSANSGKVPIASFCVEHGRWTGRAGEAAGRFGSSAKCLSSNDLKLAVKYSNNQGQVWNKVAEQQEDLASNVGGSVKPASSPSSLELTLDDAKIKTAKAGYTEKLGKLIDGKADVVGFVFAINGEVTCGDIYAGPSLMKQLWPKLIDSAVVEAVAERTPDGAKKMSTGDDVRRVLSEADRAESKSRDVNARTKAITRDAKGCVRFETTDNKSAAVPLHVNYLRKTDPAAQAGNASQNRGQQEGQQSLGPVRNERP